MTQLILFNAGLTSQYRNYTKQFPILMLMLMLKSEELLVLDSTKGPVVTLHSKF